MKDFIKSYEEELDQYPDLKEAVIKTFVTKDYPSDQLSPLTVWFRIKEEDEGYPLIENLDWDEETLEDFYSWGSNSRWAFNFEPDLMANPKDYIELAIQIAFDTKKEE